MKQSLKDQFISAYDTHVDDIFRYVYIRTGNKELSTDLTQDVFVKTWEYLQTHDVLNLRALLYRIAHNCVIDWYRKRKDESLDALQESGFDPHDETETSTFAEIQESLALIKKMNPQEQELITLRYIQDLSPKEIAHILGQTENNISVRLHRTLERMKVIMNQ